MSLSNSAFELVNNFIVNNGNAGASLFGGVQIANGGAASPQRLEHNTIARNQALTAADSVGLDCTTGQPMTARSNTIYLGIGGAPALDGNCSHEFSNIEGGAPGTGNIDADPQFVDAPGGNFHIQSGSPCQDAADPDSTVTDDIDGDARPAGAGFDIGADEIP